MLCISFFCGLSQAIEIKLNYTAIANLTYQLDCVSESIPACSDQNYKLLWNKEFLKTPEDQIRLKTWEKVMAKYKVNANLANQDLKEHIDLSHKIRAASFEAKHVEDYLSRIDLLMTTSDRIEVSKIVLHFYPLFQTWWKNTANQKGNAFLFSMKKTLSNKNIEGLINKFSHFYESELPEDFSMTLNLFFRPDYIKEPTSGQQMDNYAVTEFLPNEDPKQRIDVVIHEICHFLFISVHPNKFKSLKKKFSNLNSIAATGAYNVLNESLAAAFGNGLVNKALMPKEKWETYLNHKNSFYNNDYIDGAAKSTLPWLEELLEQKKTIYHPDFASIYVNKLKSTFGSKIDSPKVQLSYMYFIFDEKFRYNFEKDIHKNIFSTQAWWGDWNDNETLTLFKENNDVTGLIVMHKGNLQKLKNHKLISEKDFKLIKSQISKKPSLLFASKKSSSAMNYIIMSNNSTDAVFLLEELSRQDVGFEGVFKQSR